ncbi:MAG: P-type conjugative transfer protein TrbJ [Alphaproteobacteria bacterium]|nr:P-type conjugative transfer protein TrbJ [Alphaproteobacteria bacterium]
MSKRRLCCCALLGAVLLAAPAHAFIVFDPSNYSQNVLTAARTLEEINNQVRQLQNEAVMLENMAKNLSNLNYSSLSQMTGALNNIGTLMTQADGLSFNLSQLESQWEQQYPDSYDATVTTNDVAVAARQRWQNAMDAFRQTMQVQSQIVQNVRADQPILSDLVNQSQSAEGALQAQQASNQLIALSTKQQMQIQEMMASQFRAQSEDAARKAQAEEAARETTKQFLGSETAYTGSW